MSRWWQWGVLCVDTGVFSITFPKNTDLRRIAYFFYDLCKLCDNFVYKMKIWYGDILAERKPFETVFWRAIICWQFPVMFVAYFARELSCSLNMKWAAWSKHYYEMSSSSLRTNVSFYQELRLTALEQILHIFARNNNLQVCDEEQAELIYVWRSRRPMRRVWLKQTEKKVK